MLILFELVNNLYFFNSILIYIIIINYKIYTYINYVIIYIH